MPFVNTGAAGGALFAPGANPFMVSLLVNGAKRTIPCVQYLGTHGVKTAVILYNSDTYMTFVGTSAYPAQLASNNITLLETFTFLKGSTDFDAIVDRIGELQPDILLCAEQENDFGPMLLTLRTRLPAGKQPKAIVNANTTPVQVVYATSGWVADTVFGGDQWSTSFLFSDPNWGTTANFSATYQTWLQRNGFTYQMNFWDAASVIGWFVMMEALSNTVSFSHADVISALRSVELPETFFGPISFLNTGELNSTGICQQLLPSPDPTASLDSTQDRGLQVVAPVSLASAAAYYPGSFVKPPKSNARARRLRLGLGIGLGVGLFVLLALIALVFLLRHKYELILFPKTGKGGSTDW
jgi:ABC-type branched-subunit amino acid transport system substrate-binding protein